MAELSKTKRMCSNGHVMDPAWDVCPYCPGDRRGSPELARTVKVDTSPPPTPPTAAPAAPRKTELIDNSVKIAGLGFLVSVRTPTQGLTHRLDQERMTIGARSDCDIVIDGTHVSDRHASVRFRDGGFFLTDLDSTNGTFIGDTRIEQQPLADGDRVRFGSSEWVFKSVVFEK
jgi:pSer/pThr/pTyr-binding forkhead associated (FHA) protein